MGWRPFWTLPTFLRTAATARGSPGGPGQSTLRPLLPAHPKSPVQEAPHLVQITTRPCEKARPRSHGKLGTKFLGPPTPDRRPQNPVGGRKDRGNRTAQESAPKIMEDQVRLQEKPPRIPPVRRRRLALAVKQMRQMTFSGRRPYSGTPCAVRPTRGRAEQCSMRPNGQRWPALRGPLDRATR